MKPILLLFLLTLPAFPQFPRLVRFVTTNPSGACGASYITQNTVTGVLTGCVGGTWTTISTAGGVTTTAGAMFGAFPYDFLASTVSLPPVFVRTDTSFTMTAGKTGIFTPAAAFPSVQLIAGANPTGNWPGALNIDNSGNFNWSPSNGNWTTLFGTAGKTLRYNNTLTFAGTDGTTMTFPTTSATVARTDAAQSFTGVQTFVAPILGTPTSVDLTNATNVPAPAVSASAVMDWRFSEGTGTTSVDSSGNGHTLTFGASGLAPTWIAGGGISCDGGDSATATSSGPDWWTTIKTLHIAFRPDSNAMKTGANPSQILMGASGSDYINAPTSLIGGGWSVAGGGAAMWSNKLVGTHIMTIVLNPFAAYIDGVAVDGYLSNPSNVTLAASGGSVGVCSASFNPGTWGVLGNIYRIVGYTAAESLGNATTTGTVAYDVYGIRDFLNRINAPVQDDSYSGLQLVVDGDSRTENNLSNLYSNSLPKYMLDLIPQSVNLTNLAYPGYTMANINARTGTPANSISKRYPSVLPVYSLWIGVNDFAAGTAGATVEASVKTALQARANAGFRTVVATEIACGAASYCAAPWATKQGDYNTALMSDFNARTLVTQKNVALADLVNDPHLGPVGKGTVTGFKNADGIHPTVDGSKVLAPYFVQAFRAVTGDNAPTCSVYRVSVSSTNLQIGVNGSGAGDPVAIAAATSQTYPLAWLQPLRKLVSVRTKATTAFAGTGFTAITSTVGDSVGGVTYYDSASYDLTTVSNTNFSRVVLDKSSTDVGSTINLVITANQNLNTNALTGSVDVTLCVVSEAPAQ